MGDLHMHTDLTDGLADLDDSHGIAVLHGSELNIAADGSLDWDDDFLAGFDVLVASVHSDFDQTREAMTRRLLTAIEHRAPTPPWKSTPSPTGSTSTTNLCAVPENMELSSRSTPMPTRSHIWITSATASPSPSVAGCPPTR